MMYRICRSLGFLVLGFAFTGCLSNPFGENQIRGGSRSLRGEVAFHEGGPGHQVYVWLEGIELGTFTDKQGAFELVLPTDLSRNSNAPTNRLLKLYFYVANYSMRQRRVLIRDGQFVYDRGDVTKNGKLASQVVLKRFLSVRSAISPARVPENYSGIITASVTLQASVDSVTVVFPNAIGGMLGAVLLRNLDTEQVFIYEAVPGLASVESERIGFVSRTRSLGFGINQRPLPPGRYEVVPYLLIAHEPVPEALLASIAPHVIALTPNYLKLPIRRDLAILEIVR